MHYFITVLPSKRLAIFHPPERAFKAGFPLLSNEPSLATEIIFPSGLDFLGSPLPDKHNRFLAC